MLTGDSEQVAVDIAAKVGIFLNEEKIINFDEDCNYN